MTQEEKLLLKDLSARLPYGVKLLCNGWDSDGGCEFSTVETLIGIDDRFIHTLWRGEKDKHSIKEPLSILDYKPFLRPMPSMTEEEKKEFDDFCVIDEFAWKGNSEIGYKNQAIIMSDAIDWLNAHHFDYRGLISKELALEAKEGMYKIE